VLQASCKGIPSLGRGVSGIPSKWSEMAPARSRHFLATFVEATEMSFVAGSSFLSHLRAQLTRDSVL